MPRLFTPAQLKQAQAGLSECHACAEALAALNKAGFGNEAKEQENEMYRKSLEIALEYDNQQANKPDAG